MSKSQKNFRKFSPVNYTVKICTVVAHPVDRLGGKFIGFIVLNKSSWYPSGEFLLNKAERH